MPNNVCGICHQPLEGLFRDHSFETCSSAVSRQRDELLQALKAMSKAFIIISENIPKNIQIGMAEALEIETAKVRADKAIAKAEGK